MCAAYVCVCMYNICVNIRVFECLLVYVYDELFEEGSLNHVFIKIVFDVQNNLLQNLRKIRNSYE